MPEAEVAAEQLSDGEFTWLGRTFRMADRIGRMPALRFAKIASQGADSSELDGMAAMYDLLKACVHRDDWAAFEAHADEQAASDEDLWEAIRVIIQGQSGRPTVRPSDSSDGPLRTEQPSTSTPADRVIARMAGRPDLQSYARIEQQRALSAVS